MNFRLLGIAVSPCIYNRYWYLIGEVNVFIEKIVIENQNGIAVLFFELPQEDGKQIIVNEHQ